MASLRSLPSFDPSSQAAVHENGLLRFWWVFWSASEWLSYAQMRNITKRIQKIPKVSICLYIWHLAAKLSIITINHHRTIVIIIHDYHFNSENIGGGKREWQQEWGVRKGKWWRMRWIGRCVMRSIHSASRLPWWKHAVPPNQREVIRPDPSMFTLSGLWTWILNMYCDVLWDCFFAIADGVPSSSPKAFSNLLLFCSSCPRPHDRTAAIDGKANHCISQTTLSLHLAI